MRGFLVFVIALQSTLLKGFLYEPCDARRHFKPLMPPPPLFLSDNDIGSNSNQEQSFPVPLGWERSSKSSTRWNSLDDPLSNSSSSVLLRTWNWCRNFVLRLKLCPWAIKSLETEGAIQIFIIPKKQQNNQWNNNDGLICQEIAEKFSKFIKEYPHLEPAAIFFVVFVSNDDNDFIEFYNWFSDLEEYDWEVEDVIPAPFHPQWQFASDEDDQENSISSSLAFEKKAPYPTVSFVSARVVEQAGSATTEQIAHHNANILKEKTPTELQTLWQEHVINNTLP